MSEATHFSAYLCGAFAGIVLMVLVLSLLIASAYREPMLRWHAATLAVALAAQALLQQNEQVAALLWAMQLALAAQTLRVTLGVSGAARWPALALRFTSGAGVLLAALLTVLPDGFSWLLPPWLAVMGWYFFRIWKQHTPWVYWLALGQLSLAGQWLSWTSGPATPLQPGPTVQFSTTELGTLALFAIATYLGMVWFSRQHSENSLRVEAREKTDPLTGLAMPRVFFDRVDGAQIRSRNLGYTCALVLIRVENLEKIVHDHKLDNNEAVILAASHAIAASLRPQDTAARLCNNRFGVLAEGIAKGAAQQLATKIVAQGLRASQWGLPGGELHLQVVVVEIGHAQITTASLLNQLEVVLRQMVEQGVSSRIRYLTPA